MNKHDKDKEFFRFCGWQRVLKTIGNSMEQMTQTEIAERMEMQKPNVYIILYELERAGLIVRLQDKYMVQVSLTSRGRLVWKSFSDIENILGKRVTQNDR